MMQTLKEISKKEQDEITITAKGENATKGGGALSEIFGGVGKKNKDEEN